MDAHTIVRAFALVARVGRLNPSAGEIGPGMLASLVEEAVAIAAGVDGNASVAGIVADGLLLREMVALMLPTNSPAWEVAESTLQNLIELSDPTTVSEYIGHIRTAIQQSKEANT